MHSFLQDILAEPQDDALRLIYADWLEEQGQEARAEFIRVQIEMTGLEGASHLEGPQEQCKACAYSRLCDRERQLLLANNFEDFPDWVTEWTWRRGFISEVSCTCPIWMEHGHHLVREHPLERVELLDKEPITEGVWLDPIHQVFVWNFKRSPQLRLVLSDITILPMGLHDAVYRQKNHGDYFHSRQEIKDALSKGCLLWAREKALHREKKVPRTSVG